MTPHLTGAGKNLLLRALAGETITFTKMQLGSGAAQTADNAAALKNPVVSLPLTSIEVGNEYVTLSSYFSNSSLNEGFHVTEMGIFAKDPDNTSDATKEILYALGNSSVNDADYIPAKTDRIYEVQLDTMVFVGDVENITATVNSSLVYASAGDLNDHIGNKNNPHEVTKAQVGLGSVPNVTTNDQTPTYTEAEGVSNISSGEKLSVAFGKIKKAISALISHLNAKDNPHEVTAAQVGAAAAEHEHSADDITSGILSLTHGGTGVESLAALASSLIQPLQNAGGLPKVVVGTYTGTGTSGSGSWTTLTFASRPKFFVCIPQTLDVTYDSRGCCIFGIDGMSYYVAKKSFEDGVVPLYLSWGSNSVSWHLDTSYNGNEDVPAAWQNNKQGKTYVYMAIL